MSGMYRQDTTLSDIHADSAQNSYDEQHTEPAILEKSGLSRLYIDAFRFNEVLADDKDALPSKFSDLVGRDLKAPELAATERFAKLSVNSWLKTGGLDGGQLSEEPEALEDEDDEKEPQPTVQSLQAETSSQHSVEAIRSNNASNLTNEEIINLLVNEFGSLSTSEDDEEQLILETDGAFFEDVAILGMIHLTTHRLSFHASLLSTRPDLLPDQQIIKSGPLTLHRTGLLRKRRVWLELSHDMLTSFPSGNEEDRIRPIKSILLSTMKELPKEDPKYPKRLKLNIEDKQGSHISYAEFDTVESAREWRREIQGAMYMHRHRRAANLSRQQDDEMAGVRISIPLSRVKVSSSRKYLNFVTLIKVEVSQVSSQWNADGEPVTTGSRTPSTASDEDEVVDDSSPTSSEDLFRDNVDGRTIEIGVVHRSDAWDMFDSLVEKAKEREAKSTVGAPRAFVDFGALTFLEQPTNAVEYASQKEKAIRHALAFSPEAEMWYARSHISRSVASVGYFAVTSHYVGFWTKNLSCGGSKVRLHVTQIIAARPIYRLRFATYGLTLDIKEHPSMSFDFRTAEVRDEAIKRVMTAVENFSVQSSFASSLPALSRSNSSKASSEALTTESPLPLTPTSSNSNIAMVPTSLSTTSTGVLSPLSRTFDNAKTRCIANEKILQLPKVINLPPSVLPAMKPRHFVCLTIGSRGDVQPYIALAKGLQKKNHTVTIVTHAEYKDWVEGWGVEHRTAGGDPGALMKLSVEHKMFSPQFFKESLTNFRSWLDELLVDAWKQCQDAEILLESPVAMAGVHIAEALKIPYFRVFTMPWSKTTQFPHPFLSAPVDVASFNSSTYTLFDNVYWKATSGQINRWRRHTLKLSNTDMDHLAQSKIPFIYNFSPSVVPKPLDWGDATIISGYWFLDNPDLGWVPPPALAEWMANARHDGKAIVYIGFGSITVPNPPAMTRSIIKAVLKSGVRAIISKGWASRMSKPGEAEVEFPPECYPIDKIPHDWLFPQIDAALHHGGAGTTGASLRAGIPTLIKPWFGDQFFWASRVHKLGAGLKVSSLHSSELASALVKATTDQSMKEKAASVGEKIRAEDGVTNAIRAIHTYLPRAGTLRTELD